MEQKLRIMKKKHRGVFASNCITIEVSGVNPETETDEFLDAFDEHYRELVPMVTASNLRKAYHSGTAVNVNVVGQTPDTRRHEGYVAYHDGEDVFKVTFSGPTYAVNPESEHKIVERLKDITKKDVELFETCFDAWYI